MRNSARARAETGLAPLSSNRHIDPALLALSSSDYGGCVGIALLIRTHVCPRFDISGLSSSHVTNLAIAGFRYKTTRRDERH
jgi:hypothetical protein